MQKLRLRDLNLMEASNHLNDFKKNPFYSLFKLGLHFYDRWVELVNNINDYNDIVLPTILTHKLKEILARDKVKHTEILNFKFYNFRGNKIALSASKSEDTNERIWLYGLDYENIVDNLYSILNSELPRIVSLVDKKEVSDTNLKNIKDTDLSLSLSKEVKLFNSHGISRSYMFLGLPGTGKTNTAISIAKNLNYRTLIVRASEMDIANVTYMVKQLKFDCLIIDDFDKFGIRFSQFIGFFDTLKDLTKVIIISCNTIKKFDPALIRAGRINKLLEFKPNPELNQSLLGKDLYDKYNAIEWTLAECQEFKQRYDLLGQIHAEELLEEMNMRREHKEERDNEKTNSQVNVLDFD